MISAAGLAPAAGAESTCEGRRPLRRDDTELGRGTRNTRGGQTGRCRAWWTGGEKVATEGRYLCSNVVNIARGGALATADDDLPQ